MSYRDLRNFTEILRTLGYHRLISLENFRTPNFPLVAEILIWLIKRFHPEYDISAECSSSEHRILLIRSVAEFMVLKTGLKLNVKKLYQADGHAVKEMLKIASLLHDALKVKQSVGNELVSTNNFDLSSKIQELKLTRELASQITQKGSLLYEILSNEPTLREIRQMRANSQIDVNDVELLVKNMLENAQRNITQVKQQIENISSTENSLDVKISKRESDLERIKKRVQTLKKVRPAFLEEFEQLEVELNQLYEDYVIRFRCTAFLQQQLHNLHNLEEQRIYNNLLVNSEQGISMYKCQSAPSDDGDGTVSSPTPLFCTISDMYNNLLENSEQGISIYKLPAPSDDGDGTVSSPTPKSNKSRDSLHSSRKKNQGRIRTATAKGILGTTGTMYGNTNSKSKNNDDDDDDEDDDDIDEDDDDSDDLLDGDSLLNNDNDSDDLNIQHSDLDAEDSRLSDNKSDDGF